MGLMPQLSQVTPSCTSLSTSGGVWTSGSTTNKVEGLPAGSEILRNGKPELSLGSHSWHRS